MRILIPRITGADRGFFLIPLEIGRPKVAAATRSGGGGFLTGLTIFSNEVDCKNSVCFLASEWSRHREVLFMEVFRARSFPKTWPAHPDW